MRANHIVYLDCDQVFSDFVTGIFAALGFPHKVDRSWPFGRDYNVFPLAGSTREEANEHCTIDFWENLPWTHDGKELLAEVWARFRPDETMLLTKPMEHDDSYTGKARWVRREIPELHRRMVPTWVEKAEFAFDFNCLLIDDSQENVERFIRAGGAAILVPRPWNDLDKMYYAGEAVSWVAQRMDKWIAMTQHPAQLRLRKGHQACQK